MITISPLKSTTDDQISEMLLLSCTAMDLMTKTVNLLRESVPQFFYYSVLENNALLRTT